MLERIRSAIASRLGAGELRRRLEVDADVLRLCQENRRLAQHAIDDGLVIADLTRQVARLHDGNQRAATELMRRAVDLTVLEARLNARDTQLEEIEAELTELRGYPSLSMSAGVR